MTHENFNNLVDSLEEIRINTLKTKNAKYAPENDALHNFHAGAEIMGVTVPECIWGYATKHIVALRDKILRNDWKDKDDALEKIQDIQNYLTFIWCAINEENQHKENTDFDYDYIDDLPSCQECIYFKNYLEDANTEYCDGCKNNICPSKEEYKTAPIKFKKK